MNTLKFLALAAIAFLFAACKASQPTGPPSGPGPSVGEVVNALNTTQSKCYALAQANPNSSAQQVIMLTAAWLKTQSNVQNVEVFDSLIIDIGLKSGLHSIFIISLAGPDGLALTRGGGPPCKPLRFGPSVPAAHTLTNKNVLIYAPFVAGQQNNDNMTNLYAQFEIDNVAKIFENANQGFKVKILYGDSVSEIGTFGNYGIVFIDTHGIPSGFCSNVTPSGPVYDTTLSDAAIKSNWDEWPRMGPGAYEAVQNGSLILSGLANWQSFRKQSASSIFTVIIGSKYIASLPPMPNTIIMGNFCYSGWANGDTTKNPSFVPLNPIYPAFISLHPLAYYSYGYPDGTSSAVDNTFGKRMEDSLAQALAVYGDSTGDAYLMADGTQYTGRRLGGISTFVDIPFIHFGLDDYSYMPCIDSFTDVRDGQLYHTICIGDQIWMQKNLNYNAPGSFYYKNSPALGAIYGRIYPWTVAMNGAASSNATPSGVRGVCPYGWHIPSSVEWQVLRTATYSANAIILNSTNPNIGGWPNDTSATNSSGFSALAGGFFNYGSRLTSGPDSGFEQMGNTALFHASTIAPSGLPVCIWVSSSWPIAKGDVQPSSDPSDPNQPSSNAYCRCIKDP